MGDVVQYRFRRFALVHEILEGRIPLVHADLYRLGEPDELVELGLVPRIGGDALVVVEWGDRFREELGAQGLWLWLSLDENGRGVA